MNRLSLVLIAATLGSASFPTLAQAQSTVPPPSKLLSDVGFIGSECVRYDDQADDYLVSNIGAEGQGGFLSRVSPEGTVTNLKWIVNGQNGVVLERPLGIFFKGDLVYIADTKAIRKFDRKTGTPRGSIDVPDAIRLNDLTVAADGTIFVTDTGDNDHPGALFTVSPSGVVSTFAARNDALEKPNGIAVLPDGRIVHGGRGVNLVFRDRSGQILSERTLPTGRFDGIIPLPNGELLVASQDGHNVYLVPPLGAPRIVADAIAVPAAIGWDSKRNRLLVPQIRLASLGFYELRN